jgi:hypothetical protein
VVRHLRPRHVVAGEELVGMIGREQILHYVRVRAELGV